MSTLSPASAHSHPPSPCRGAATSPPSELPRLLTDREAARYLGISRATVRALVARSVIPRVLIPACHDGARPGRRLLIDVRDLDRLITSWKGGR